jgi:indole-3-glycerol phosphate synthase
LILDNIVKDKQLELEARKRNLSMVKIQERARSMPPSLNLVSALKGPSVKLIAEVKKASPSRGIICPDFNPVEIARTYAKNGASAISVLTESKYFQGSLDYLENISHSLDEPRLPLLRKDFIFDPYQVYESRAFGADALLLIVAILEREQFQDLLKLSHYLNLSCLVEVHNEAEAEIAIQSGARIIGINNRDLQTFKVDFSTTGRLRQLIPPDRIVVSESGIKSRADMESLKSLGVNGALVGEYLLASRDIPSRMRELL